MTQPDLLPCPFCGRQPKLDARGVQGHEDCAWTFISCDCRARPHVGESCSWRWAVRDGWSYRTHVGMSKEDAGTKATESAASAWNQRAPVVGLTPQAPVVVPRNLLVDSPAAVEYIAEKLAFDAGARWGHLVECERDMWRDKARAARVKAWYAAQAKEERHDL